MILSRDSSPAAQNDNKSRVAADSNRISSVITTPARDDKPSHL
ncbi:hypothetical protein [Helicobacter marmotae]|nr:hypothetical protein [Helicobacter marmotae]